MASAPAESWDSRCREGSANSALLGGSGLAHEVAQGDAPASHDAGVRAAQTEVPPERRVDEAHRVAPETRRELRTAAVRRRADLDESVADPQQRARREIVVAQVEIDEELV